MPTTPRAMFFTQQTVGLAARKTSMVFLAESFADLGFRTAVVTAQLSFLSRLRRNNKLRGIPPERRNCWYRAGKLDAFVWVPAVHPIRLPSDLLNRLTGPLVAAYGALLPRAIVEIASAADVMVIESCCAVALFRRLRALNPQAKFIYSMSDRLTSVGMHPMLQRLIAEDAADYDLLRVPAEALLADFPGAKARFIPHGLDKSAFDGVTVSPYGHRPNAVLAGDMMLDRALLCHLAARFPQVDFHYFGRALQDKSGPLNIHDHGEVPFRKLVPYIKHADVGLSLYRAHPTLDYLAQSSLKNMQYAYCGLPIVAPHFVCAGWAEVHGYDPADPDSACAAFAAALECGRVQGPPAIADWQEVARTILREVGW